MIIMKREELISLIDKVTSGKGILRTTGYWMRRLFKAVLGYSDAKAEEVIGYSDSKAEEVKAYTDDAVKSTMTSVVEVTDITLEMQPNVYYHYVGSNLAITLAPPSKEDVLNEYMIKIVCTDSPMISLPTGLTWASDAPSFESGVTYQISIIDNLAVFAEFITE